MNKTIANWDTLSDEDKKKATELLKGQPGLNAATVHPAAKFLKNTVGLKSKNILIQIWQIYCITMFS